MPSRPAQSRIRLLLATGVALCLAWGCSSAPSPSSSPSAALSGTDEQIFLNDTIEKNYDPHVIMKRAETFFERENYPEAIVEYQHFLDMHRAHVLAPYAQFKLAESHFKMAKTVDRDPGPITKALEQYERLLREYPGSKYEIDALVKIRQSHNWLGEVDLMVGRFYLRQEAYLAAAHRFERIVERDRELDVVPDALYYLAVVYNELGAGDWARERLVLLAQRYPYHAHKREAQALLASLGGAPAPLAVAQQSTPQPASPTVGVSANGHRPAPPPALDSALSNGVNGATGHHGVNGSGPYAAPLQIEPVSMSRSSSASPGGTDQCTLGDWC